MMADAWVGSLNSVDGWMAKEELGSSRRIGARR
jgi:hypothetical protein